MATRVKCSNGERSAELTKAILLYGSNHSLTFVSIHDIEGDANNPRIGVGIPATKQSIAEIFRELMPGALKARTILPWNVLSSDHDHLAWYTLPTKKRLWFRSEKFGGDLSGEVSLPGLVFLVTNGNWYVFAHKLSVRPLPDTPLYVAPFFNVWSGGNICTGNVKKPEIFGPESIQEWEDAFFRSYFTHPNIHNPNELITYKGGPYQLWKKLLTGKLKNFPMDALVDAKISLGDALVNKLAQEKS